MIRPEKMVDRLIKMAPASAIAAANKPLDAGRAMTITSNLGHLIEQDATQLFIDVGDIYPFLSGNDLATFTGDIARDGGPGNAAGTARVANQIGWTDRTARRYGPFAIIADEGDSPVNAKPRKVRVIAEFDAVGSVDHAAMCAAITAGPSPDEIIAGREMAYASVVLSPTATQARFDLEPDIIIDATYAPQIAVPSAPNGSGATMTQLHTFYVWIAWAMYDGSPLSFALQTISAYEYR